MSWDYTLMILSANLIKRIFNIYTTTANQTISIHSEDTSRIDERRSTHTNDLLI